MIYYPRNHDKVMTPSLRLVANKGYALMYNLGSPLDAKYPAILESAIEMASAIGPGVPHIAKHNLFPQIADTSLSPECIYDTEIMRSILDRIPKILFPFTHSAIDLEPSSSLTKDTPYAFWKSGSANQGKMIKAEYSMSADYLLPYAPQTTFYGGLFCHFWGQWISEETYFVGDKTALIPQVMPGVGVSVDGSNKTYKACDVLKVFPGREKFIFPAVTGNTLIEIAKQLPRLERE